LSKRKNPTSTQRKRLLKRNAHRCCVCKEAGVGLELHHIDGDPSNTIDENLAVLCVRDHDLHHRPIAYDLVKHTELGSEKLRKYKASWEKFVTEAQSDNPKVIATLNVFGTIDYIHSAKLIMQWQNEEIEYERVFHLLDGDFDYWTDEILKEVLDIGKNIKLAVINEPLPVEHCPCCGKGLSNTLGEGVVLKLTDERWKEQSICSIYINPEQPSLAVIISLSDKPIFEGSLHLCQEKYLHFASNYYEERIKVNRRPSIRTQATRIIGKLINDWEPAHIFIGTGDYDNPELIGDLILPRVWEVKAR
jgi:hypothetical protein